MSETTTETTTILEGLLTTELFKGLTEITEADIQAVKDRIGKDRGSNPENAVKGHIAGKLSDFEVRLYTLYCKLGDECQAIAAEGVSLLEKQGQKIDYDQQLAMVRDIKAKKRQRKILDDILWYNLDVRFAEEMAKPESCQKSIDPDFNVRITTHEEEHGSHGERIMVVGFGDLEGMLQMMRGGH
jgi:hypothetical protein